MPDDAAEIARLRAELAATKADLAQARAVVSASEAMISHLKLEIAKLQRAQYGQRSERRARLADVLARMPNMLVSRLPEPLPWNWRPHSEKRRAA